MVELKPAADVLGGLTGLREVPARERNVAARRADDQVPRVVVRHLDPQPRQERCHVLARERARLLAAVITSMQILGQVPHPAQVAVRRPQLPAREPLDRVPLHRLAQPPLVQPGEVHRALLAQPEHAQVPHVLDALLLRRRRQPPRRDDRDLQRPLRRVGARQLTELPDRADPRPGDVRPRHREAVERHRDPIRLDQQLQPGEQLPLDQLRDRAASRPASRQAAAATDPPQETVPSPRRACSAGIFFQRR